jgi:isopenicillin-N epimerase
MTAALPARSPFASHWAHDPGIVFLNHGSFGATPRAVLEAQNALRARLEAEPVAFFVEHITGLIDASRAALGQMLGADPACIAPVPNATVGVATVLHNLKLAPGDEILINDHEYPACCNNARHVAAMRGAKVVSAELPFPMPSPEAIVEAIMAKVTARTRVVMISHVTSSSGAILPIERLIPELHRRGIETLIDGAHAPGFTPFNLSALKPTYYTANCHKWICSPKGSAFLYVDPAKREGFRPIVLSNNAEKPKPGRSQFLTEFDYVGTTDQTAFLAIPDAIRFMSGLLRGGWSELMASNRALLLEGRRILCDALGITPPIPESMLGCLCTMPLPSHAPDVQARVLARPSPRGYHDAMQDILLEKWKIQVPLWNVAGKTRVFRISAQIYNTREQYEYLARALREELAAEAKL